LFRKELKTAQEALCIEEFSLIQTA
jgi:hypothetical protein